MVVAATSQAHQTHLVPKTLRLSTGRRFKLSRRLPAEETAARTTRQRRWRTEARGPARLLLDPTAAPHRLRRVDMALAAAQHALAAVLHPRAEPHHVLPPLPLHLPRSKHPRRPCQEDHRGWNLSPRTTLSAPSFACTISSAPRQRETARRKVAGLREQRHLLGLAAGGR